MAAVDQAFADFFNGATQSNPLNGAGISLSGDINEDLYNNEIPENNEGLVYLALAYVSADNDRASIQWDINGWDDITITSKFPRRYNVIMDGDGPDAVVDRTGDNANGELPTWTPGNHDVNDYGKYNVQNITHCPNPDATISFRTIVNGRDDWKQIWLDLVNAKQVSGLTAGHVKSYMKWIGAEEIEGEYLSKQFGYLIGNVPKISDHAGLRARLRGGKWTDYRSTFAAIVGLIVRMLNELPPQYAGIFSDATRALIEHSSENSYSEDAFRDIPTIVLAYAYCWNVVTDLKLEGLQSGKRAYNDLSYAHRESMKNVLTEAKSKIKVWKSGIGSSISNLPRSLYDV